MDRKEKTTLQKRIEAEGITVKVNGRYLRNKNGKIRVFKDLDVATREGRKATFIQDAAKFGACIGGALLAVGAAYMSIMPEFAGWEAAIGGAITAVSLLTLMRYR